MAPKLNIEIDQIRKGGGIAVYMNIDILYTNRADLESTEIESIWIKIKFLICFTYQPPDSPPSWANHFEIQL